MAIADRSRMGEVLSEWQQIRGRSAQSGTWLVAGELLGACEIARLPMKLDEGSEGGYLLGLID